MLRFINNISLSNPSKPEIPAINVKAVVTEDNFGLAVGHTVVEQLKLGQSGFRETLEIEENVRRLVPFVGPLRVAFGGREVETGALHCSDGVVLGKRLAEELGLRKQPPEALAPSVMRLFQESSPDKIMRMEQAVDSGTIRTIRDYSLTRPRKEAHVAGADPSEGYLRKDIRDCYKVDIDNAMAGLLRKVSYDLMSRCIEPFFGVEIDSWEPPYLLLYLPGGHFSLHHDATRWVARPSGEGYWDGRLDRDISLILYVNNDFTGGKLDFPQQKVKIEPKPGLLVAFPATRQYQHAAEPTQSGERLAVVTWATIKGSPRVNKRPRGRIFMNDLRKSA